MHLVDWVLFPKIVESWKLNFLEGSKQKYCEPQALTWESVGWCSERFRFKITENYFSKCPLFAPFKTIHEIRFSSIFKSNSPIKCLYKSRTLKGAFEAVVIHLQSNIYKNEILLNSEQLCLLLKFWDSCWKPSYLKWHSNFMWARILQSISCFEDICL